MEGQAECSDQKIENFDVVDRVDMRARERTWRLEDADERQVVLYRVVWRGLALGREKVQNIAQWVLDGQVIWVFADLASSAHEMLVVGCLNVVVMPLPAATRTSLARYGSTKSVPKPEKDAEASRGTCT